MASQEHANQRQSAQGMANQVEVADVEDDQYLHLFSHLIDY